MEHYIEEVKGYIIDLKERIKAKDGDIEELEMNLEGWEDELKRLEK